ncbi:MAG: DUF4494 domain-containing protein [Muribaculaceae bacterium]|nr:DUF4494 domain-containing protein [Muribaculaceae bacterium]
MAMSLWFEVAVRFDKMQENGLVRKTTERYLVDALTFSNAEERTIEKVTPFISGEFSVSVARKTKIAEIFFDESDYADKWYLVKVNFITLDEKSGKEKKSLQQILVQAGDFENALGRFQDGMKGTMADYRIASISETPIMDVYPYEYKTEGAE